MLVVQKFYHLLRCECLLHADFLPCLDHKILQALDEVDILAYLNVNDIIVFKLGVLHLRYLAAKIFGLLGLFDGLDLHHCV